MKVTLARWSRALVPLLRCRPVLALVTYIENDFVFSSTF